MDKALHNKTTGNMFLKGTLLAQEMKPRIHKRELRNLWRETITTQGVIILYK